MARTSRPQLCCVYRRRNAQTVQSLVAEAVQADVTPRLWALDEIAPSLSQWSVGVGPGGKFELCNRLLDGRFDAVTIVVDDDVRLLKPLSMFLELAEIADLHICQPAHAADSYATYPFTVARDDCVVRLSALVEIGPIFCVRGRALPLVLPFPPRSGMGWGLDVQWSSLRRRGIRLGIVDATPMQHLVPAGGAYDVDAEARRLRWQLRRRFVFDIRRLQKVVAEWRVGEETPPWLRRGDDAM